MSLTARLTLEVARAQSLPPMPVQARGVATEVARDHAHLVARDEQLVALRVLEDQVVALGAGELAVRDAGVAPHAVDPVHREVARLELVGDRLDAPPREPRRGAGVPAGAEQVLLGGDRERAGLEDEAVRERRLDGLHRAPRRSPRRCASSEPCPRAVTISR